MGKNKAMMNESVEKALTKLRRYPGVKKVDTKEFTTLKVYGIMKFHQEQYEMEEIGNLAIMRMNMGLMQMSTIVFTPFYKNLPLLSVDYIYAMSNRKAYVELYDLVEEKDEIYMSYMEKFAQVKEKYAALTDNAVTEAWYQPYITVATYKAGTKKEDKELHEVFYDTLDVYLEMAKELPLLDKEQKEKKLKIIREYTNGLVDKGGVSTDVFKKSLGVDKTKEFFAKVLFGTDTFK